MYKTVSVFNTSFSGCHDVNLFAKFSHSSGVNLLPVYFIRYNKMWQNRHAAEKDVSNLRSLNLKV